MAVQLDVTSNLDFPGDFLRRYQPRDASGDITYRGGYYGTVGELNAYGITFGPPKLESPNKLVITVERDDPEEVHMVKKAFGKWGKVTPHGQQNASGAGAGQAGLKPAKE